MKYVLSGVNTAQRLDLDVLAKTEQNQLYRKLLLLTTVDNIVLK